MPTPIRLGELVLGQAWPVCGRSIPGGVACCASVHEELDGKAAAATRVRDWAVVERRVAQLLSLRPDLWETT